jgi:hypothetical protein
LRLTRRGARPGQRVQHLAEVLIDSEVAFTLPHHEPSLRKVLRRPGSSRAALARALDSPVTGSRHYLVTEFDTDDESRYVTEVCWPIFQATPSS